MKLFDSKITGIILAALFFISLIGLLSSLYQTRILCLILCIMSALNFCAYDSKKEERKRHSKIAKRIIHAENIKKRF